jgi:hypothetical protein
MKEFRSVISTSELEITDFTLTKSVFASRVTSAQLSRSEMDKKPTAPARERDFRRVRGGCLMS